MARSPKAYLCRINGGQPTILSPAFPGDVPEEEFLRQGRDLWKSTLFTIHVDARGVSVKGLSSEQVKALQDKFHAQLREQAREHAQHLTALAVDVTSLDFDVEHGRGTSWQIQQPLVRAYENDTATAPVTDKVGDKGTDDEGAYRVRHPEPDEAAYEQPMMNYLWPLPELRLDRERAAQLLALANLPLCLVHGRGIPTRNALALTGGGMDLGWEIAGAYVTLGYLPPVDLRLPNMVGIHYDQEHALIIEALRRSIEITKLRAGHHQNGLDSLEAEVLSA